MKRVSVPSLEDRSSIEALFVRYTCALDAGDVDTVVSCFAVDGTLESPAVGKHTGHSAIREFAQRFARFRERGNQLRHIVSNFRIGVDADSAVVQCYLVVFLTRDGNSRMLAPGSYDCTLARKDGAWVFERRVVTMDHDYELEGI